MKRAVKQRSKRGLGPVLHCTRWVCGLWGRGLSVVVVIEVVVSAVGIVNG